jgi:outer membrane protein OmpA-like peptidoglycan-associated protein
VGGKYRGLELPGQGKSGVNKVLPPGEWVDVAITVDGPYWKMYLDGERVANVPKYDFPRAPKLHVFMNTYRYSLMLDDIRIAEGGPRSLYDDLQAAGFISTTAIRFDTGSATLRPESTGILNDVLGMLKDHEDVELLIEGHTDSQGSDAANQTLSEQRAAAVAAYMTGRGIDAGRLETAGHGESQAVADNATAEGRAMNRRVVFRQR